MEMIISNRVAPQGRIDASKVAVLAVHWQNDLVLPQGAFGPIFAQEIERQQLIPRTARVLDAVRAAGGTVIYVNVAFTPGFGDVIANSGLFRTAIKTNGFVRGTPGVRVVDELAPKPGDFQVEHSRISAFYGNDIELVLRKRGIEAVVVTGVATNVAVDHTVRDALELGFDTILLEDCCCSSNTQYHDAALLTLRVLATWVTKAEEFLARLAPGESST
jgi:nicotinamidase-related amidase